MNTNRVRVATVIGTVFSCLAGCSGDPEKTAPTTTLQKADGTKTLSQNLAGQKTAGVTNFPLIVFANEPDTHQKKKVDTSRFGDIEREFTTISKKRESLGATYSTMVNKVAQTYTKAYLKKHEGKQPTTPKEIKAFQEGYQRAMDEDPGIKDWKRTQARMLELQQILKNRIRSIDGQIRVSGVVVDEKGKPIPNVKLHIIRGESGEKAAQQVLTLPQGRFGFRVRGGIPTSLRFYKKGYYRRQRGDMTLEMTRDEQSKMINQALKNTLPPLLVIQRNNLRVTLEKQGKVTRLKPYYERLEFFADGSGKAIDFDKSSSDLLGKSLHELKSVDKRESWPRHSAVLIAKTKATGKNVTIPYSEQQYRDIGVIGTHWAPMSAKLVLSDPAGGFQLIKPIKRDGQLQYDRIKTAPKDGYDEKELQLDADSLKKGALPHFYFKVKGKFGWGRVRTIEVSKDGNSLAALIEFRLQPDGSRNLEEN